jgi:uncharacterized protein (DUF1778 family)
MESKRRKENPDRYNMRLSPELKQQVAIAAKLKGLPTSGYVKAVLYETSCRDIQEHKFLELTLRDRELFVNALLNPSEPSQKSVESVKRFKEQLGI